MDKKIESSYIPFDVAAGVVEWDKGVQGGETSNVEALNKIFKWMRGFQYGWYGWSNDGKGTMFDYLAVMKAKFDHWKFCMFKQEDMDSTARMVNGKREIKVSANRIYKNLAWTWTGKTWSKNFAIEHRCARMELKEEQELIADEICKKFFIIYPSDRRYRNIYDNFMFMSEVYGIDAFLIDPFKSLILPDNERGDERLNRVFIEIKELALKTNTVVNYINHPRSLKDVREKDGAYKVVDAFMQLGGSAWDINMDVQMSVHRPYRHKHPNDPTVDLYNLKVRQAEIVGISKGMYEGAIFDPIKKQYYFNGVNPMTGELMSKDQLNVFGKQPEGKKKKATAQEEDIPSWAKPASEPERKPDDMPF